ncbi:MAG: oxygen-independent coproporphyrinogen oxidase [Verrucomicrobiaceae bacterium]|nr:oxygen-independent coproporphyrinogen oxidase [Verrucomicrobiaceae bacterium]
MNKKSVAPALNFQRALIEKYSANGPRYTSYPTALNFFDNFGADAYAQLLGAEKNTDAPLSLYVHIPFCENICYYCACNKIVTPNKLNARQYLDYLEKEMRMQSALIGNKRPVTQLHWGGGTPTFLSAAEMTELMCSIAGNFKLLDSIEREYSIEIDPRTVTGETLALLKGLGFNRLSFGVQDFDYGVQRAVNRVQSFAQVENLIHEARELGFDAIGVDLIYGLPLQSIKSLNQTLQKTLALAPNRIAFYNYAHLPQQFSSQRAIDRLALPSAHKKLVMLELANTVLSAAGYLNIGMDHFVRADDSLALAQKRGTLQRNFQGYSTALAPDLIGMGVSAIGSTEQGYAQNEKTLADYYRRLDQNQLPIARGLRLTADDQLRRFVIMQIICNLHLDIRAVEIKFAICFAEYFSDEREQLELLAADGLLTESANYITVTSSGRFLLRTICMVFDRYLSPVFNRSYSQVI